MEVVNTLGNNSNVMNVGIINKILMTDSKKSAYPCTLTFIIILQSQLMYSGWKFITQRFRKASDIELYEHIYKFHLE